MAEYRTVRMSFWNDPFIEDLAPLSKFLYMYLFTCSHANNLGLLEITRKKMAFETGLAVEQIEDILADFERAGKIVTDGLAVWMINFVKNQTATSEKMIKGLQTLIKQVSSEKILEALFRKYPYLFDGMDTPTLAADTPSMGMDTPSTPKIPVEEMEEEREVEVEEEDISGKSPGAACSALPEFLEFAGEFQAVVQREHGKLAPKITQALIAEGAKELDRAERLDGLDMEEAKAALLWAVTDGFWGENVRSLRNIRQKMKNGLTKIQGVILAYRKAHPAESSDNWLDNAI
jgi:hypothetical protein